MMKEPAEKSNNPKSTGEHREIQAWVQQLQDLGVD